MKITIDLEKDSKEQLRLVKKLIEMKIYSSDSIAYETQYLKIKTDNKKTIIVKDIINKLIDKLGPVTPIYDVIDETKKQNIEEKETISIINNLKRGGYVMEPREGFIQVV